MKTLNTLLTLSLLLVGHATFAGSDGKKSDTKSNVPVAPSVWNGPVIEAPSSLKFIKAKNAFVPVASFELGNPSDVPTALLTVPAAPIIFGDSDEDIPENLAYIKAKFAFVPVAPFIWGDPAVGNLELGIK